MIVTFLKDFQDHKRGDIADVNDSYARNLFSESMAVLGERKLGALPAPPAPPAPPVVTPAAPDELPVLSEPPAPLEF